MKCSKCGAEIPDGSSTCPKCDKCGNVSGGFGKILGILAVALAAVMLLAYLVFARPFLVAKPLADAVPGDSTAFVSVDLYNAARTGLRYVNAVGRKRLMNMFKTEEVKEKEKGPNLFGLIRPWLSREVVFVAGDMSSETPQIAMLLSSHNIGAAEKNMPKIFEAARDMYAGGLEKNDPKAAKQFASMKIAFDKKAYKGVNIFCFKPDGKTPGNDEPGLCWASTKRAVVLSPTRVYAEHVVDAINGEKSAAQKYFAEMRNKEISKNYIYYAFVNGEQFTKLAAQQKQFEGKNGEMAMKELQAVKGMLISLVYNKLSPTMTASLMLDEKKIKDTQYLVKAVDFKSAAHKIDKEVYKKDTIAYLTLNNVGTMLRSGVESSKQDPEFAKSLEETGRNMDVDIADFLNSVGEELAVALVDLKLDEKADYPYIPSIIGAIEVKDKEVFIRSIKRMINAGNKNVEDPAEQIKITTEGKDIYILDIPNITRMSKVFKPCLGVTDNFVYFSLDPKMLKEFIGGGKGESSGVTSNLAVIINPSKAAGFMEQTYTSNKKRMSKDQAKQAEKLQGFVLGLLDVFGPASLSLGMQPDKVTASFTQVVNKRGLRKLPIEDAYAIYKEQQIQKEQEASFKKCMIALDEISKGMEAYSAEDDMGSYAGVDKSGNKIAPYIMPQCAPGECKGKVKEFVDTYCEKGSFSIELANENGFILKANPVGLPKLDMCVGPFGMKNYTMFSEYLKSPKKTCDFGF